MGADPRLLRAIVADPVDAEIATDAGRAELTIAREIQASVGDVWERLTQPEQAATWSPLVPDRPIVAVGPVRVREAPEVPATTEQVDLVNAPNELRHSWGPDTLHWRLEPLDGTVRLTLSHRVADATNAASIAAGWHICLAVLQASIRLDDIERVVGARAHDYGYDSLLAAYRDRFAH